MSTRLEQRGVRNGAAIATRLCTRRVAMAASPRPPGVGATRRAERDHDRCGAGDDEQLPRLGRWWRKLRTQRYEASSPAHYPAKGGGRVAEASPKAVRGGNDVSCGVSSRVLPASHRSITPSVAVARDPNRSKQLRSS